MIEWSPKSPLNPDQERAITLPITFEKHIEHIRSDVADIDLFIVPWDSQIVGYTVAQIERVVLKSGVNAALPFEPLASWLVDRDVRLASCRLGNDDLRESMLLESTGFRFVEMVFSPVLSGIGDIPQDDNDFVIAEAQPGDLPAIEQIAASAFTTGRFLVDWRLDETSNSRRYSAWMHNAFHDPGQSVLKASVGDDLVGFFVIEARPDRSVYWHLTAIAPSWQGRGLGKRLWRAMIARHRNEGASSVVTTISAHNMAVMNIYARLGFRFTDPRATFHWVRS
jgi:RimJ/RimL family protein N-acetyltransferase